MILKKTAMKREMASGKRIRKTGNANEADDVDQEDKLLKMVRNQSWLSVISALKSNKGILVIRSPYLNMWMIKISSRSFILEH